MQLLAITTDLSVRADWDADVSRDAIALAMIMMVSTTSSVPTVQLHETNPLIARVTTETITQVFTTK